MALVSREYHVVVALKPRHIEYLNKLAAGMSVEDIAADYKITGQAIWKTLRSLRDANNCKTDMQLIAKWMEEKRGGVVEDPAPGSASGRG